MYGRTHIQRQRRRKSSGRNFKKYLQFNEIFQNLCWSWHTSYKTLSSHLGCMLCTVLVYARVLLSLFLFMWHSIFQCFRLVFLYFCLLLLASNVQLAHASSQSLYLYYYIGCACKLHLWFLHCSFSHWK